MGTGLYGEHMARYFRPEQLATLVTRTPHEQLVAVTRLRRDAPGHGPNLAALPEEDAFLFSLQLREVAEFRASIHGRPVGASHLRAGAMVFTDLRAPPDVHVESPFDSLVVYVRRAVLDEVARDARQGRFGEFTCPVLDNLDDAAAYSLACSLLPVLDGALESDALFVDHVCWALCNHLALRYARFQSAPRRGGLTPRQLQRSQELMSARLAGSLTLAQLADECGLSRSHFLRAFRQSTGVTPYRWLARRRVEHAQQLLRDGDLPLHEVARAAGFADASHLSRTFTQQLGTSPTHFRRSVRRAGKTA